MLGNEWLSLPVCSRNESIGSEYPAQEKAESQNHLVPISPVLLPEDEHFLPLRRRSGEITAKFAEGRLGARALSPVKAGTGLEMNMCAAWNRGPHSLAVPL